ncbi:MAG: response regulator [Methanobacterium sp.]|uniref:response regulator n=1 Tax=Methanobacterium sp. TaxID=2164 RepID=UPI003D658468|nr:response regulator [Methanobacterium sp.]
MVNARILVVEDERITAEDIKDSLINLGYEVSDLVSSGEEAVRKVEELQPDLILMDIRLEGEMDGIEAADKIREKYDIPVIYLTAYSDNKTLERAKKSEPSGFILKESSGIIYKPFEEDELHSIIEITRYKHKMEKDHEKWVSSLLENIDEGLIAIGHKGTIKFMNHIAENITGWLQKDAADRDLNEVFKIYDMESGAIKEIKLDNGTYSLGEVLLINKKGEKVSLNAKLNDMGDTGGEIEGMALTFRHMG